jgi:hypothetical protein
MRTGGFPHPIVGTDWAALAERYADSPSIVQPVAEVVRSVARSPARGALLYSTSMWDLLVTTAPSTPPPVDMVVVRSPMGLGNIAAGRVLVEHWPLVGIADSIERDDTDAVPLFWRFMIEKYGVHPDR